MEDTCEAFISVANSTMTIGEVLNSASNFEISIGKTAKLIAELMDSKIEIEHEQKRIRPINSEVKRLYGCNRKIKKLTNWSPSYQNLDGFKKGLEITIKWFSDKKNFKRYKYNYII